MYDYAEEPLVSLFRDTYQPIRPLTIIWQNLEITITEIGYIKKLQEGQTVRHIFSCTDGLNFYELFFDDSHIPLLIEHVLEK